MILPQFYTDDIIKRAILEDINYALANASLKASKLPNDLSINSFIFPVGTTCAALWGWKVSK